MYNKKLQIKINVFKKTALLFHYYCNVHRTDYFVGWQFKTGQSFCTESYRDWSGLWRGIFRIPSNVAVLLPPPLLLLKGGDYDGVVVAHLHAPLVAGQGAEGDVRDRKVVPL